MKKNLFLKFFDSSEDETHKFVSELEYSDRFVIIRSLVLYPLVLGEYCELYGVLEGLSESDERKINIFNQELIKQFYVVVQEYNTSGLITGIEVEELALLVLTPNNIDEIVENYPERLKQSFIRTLNHSLDENLKREFKERYGLLALQAKEAFKKR